MECLGLLGRVITSVQNQGQTPYGIGLSRACPRLQLGAETSTAEALHP
ncbi:MAG: hypothetical protein ACO3NK_14405 [Prochlorotrichaceae cyanobacterium]